jgi:hypothetical protein
MEKNTMFAGPVLVCGDCGMRFRARRVTDGVEEICDACYEVRFPASSSETETHSANRHWPHRNLAAD